MRLGDWRMTGEDTRFVFAASGVRIKAMPDNDIFVGTIHDANTSPKRIHDGRWQSRPVELVETPHGRAAIAFDAWAVQYARFTSPWRAGESPSQSEGSRVGVAAAQQAQCLLLSPHPGSLRDIADASRRRSSPTPAEGRLRLPLLGRVAPSTRRDQMPAPPAIGGPRWYRRRSASATSFRARRWCAGFTVSATRSICCWRPTIRAPWTCSALLPSCGG